MNEINVRSRKNTRRILFISRAYPPILGGIERQNYELVAQLRAKVQLTLIANKWGKKFLPFFLPYALARATLSSRNYDIVLLGDGLLAGLGWVIRKISTTPVACIL